MEGCLEHRYHLTVSVVPVILQSRLKRDCTPPAFYLKYIKQAGLNSTAGAHSRCPGGHKGRRQSWRLGGSSLMAGILAGGSGLPSCQCTLQGPGTGYASCSGSEMIVPSPLKNQWCHRAHLTTPWTAAGYTGAQTQLFY